MTHEELTAFLREARNPDKIHSFDIERFNKGPKTPYDLLEEVENREVHLSLNEEGRPQRFAISILMFIRHGNYWLEETYRIYRGRKVVRPTRGQAGSETLIRGESQIDAAIRGFWEENGLKVQAEHLDWSIRKDPKHESKMLGWKLDSHESSVYLGWLSVTLVYPVVLDLKKLGFKRRPWKKGRTLRDKNVTLRSTWKYHEETRTKDLLGDDHSVPSRSGAVIMASLSKSDQRMVEGLVQMETPIIDLLLGDPLVPTTTSLKKAVRRCDEFMDRLR